MDSSVRVGYLIAAVTVLIWAGFVIVGRLAGTSTLNGNDVAALRFGVAAVLLFPLWLVRYRFAFWNVRLLTLAATGGIAYALLTYWAFRFAPAAHGAVLLSGVLPFFVALMSWLILQQKPGRSSRVALLIIALGGLALGAHSIESLRATWRGDLMLLGASLLWGLYTVLVRKWALSPMETTLGVTLLSAVLFIPVYLLFLPSHLSVAPWSEVLLQGFYQGVLVAVVAMLLYMQALKRLGPVRLGTCMAMVPALAGIGAVLLLGESFSWLLLLGLVLTSLGAFVGTRQWGP